MRPAPLTIALVTTLVPGSAPAQWVEFDDETSTMLTVSSVPLNDGEEKDIAVADFDRDGWMDVLVVRKEPFSNPGPRIDVLFMNENGVLVDRSTTYAPDFATNPTDARDVVVADFTGDEWPDVVIANTFHQQPTFYRNLGGDPWQGLDLETGRLPALAPAGQDPGPGPLFCAVDAGELDGNPGLDLYFSNYNPGGTATVDVLLVNNGSGVFADQSAARLGSYANVAFGSGCQIIDINNDSFEDIIKISTLFDVPPWNELGVFILFNDGNGDFDALPYQEVPTDQEYMFWAAHLNSDAFLDMYVVQDPQDQTCLGTGINPDGTVNFDIQSLGGNSPRTTSFGGNIAFVDIDNDFDLDIGVCPVDVDIQNCTGGQAGEFALLENDGSGRFSDPFGPDQNFHLRPHDQVFLDIDRDGCQDMFMGLCTGYAVFRQSSCVGTDAPEAAAAETGRYGLRVTPNPAWGGARLDLTVGTRSDVPVTLKIYDVRGTLVRSLWEGRAAAAPPSLRWDGRNEDGQRVPAGVYFARLATPSVQSERKIQLIR